VTHEHIAPAREDDRADTQLLHTLWIDDRSDGGSKDDKFDRDMALLLQGLKEEPDNSRYMFYLAGTHYGLNEFPEAIYWYQRRIADTHNTFEEEAWYATYRIGQCYARMGFVADAYFWYTAAI